MADKADKKPATSSSPFVKALGKLFGFNVGGGADAVKRAGNVFTRAAKRIEKDTETLKRKKR